MKYYNIEIAYLYYQSQKEALQGIKDLINKEQIECCFKECVMSLYSDDLKNATKLDKEYHYLNFHEAILKNKHLKMISFKKIITSSIL